MTYEEKLDQAAAASRTKLLATVCREYQRRPPFCVTLRYVALRCVALRCVLWSNKNSIHRRPEAGGRRPEAGGRRLFTLVTMTLALSLLFAATALAAPGLYSLGSASAAADCLAEPVYCGRKNLYNAAAIRRAMEQAGGAYDELFDKTKRSRVVRSAPSKPEDGLTPACRQRVRVTRPRMARGPGGDIAMVIQTREYTQSVEGVICDHIGQDQDKCGEAVGMFHSGRTACVQQYQTHKLVTLNRTNQVVMETLEFPAGCTCYWDAPPTGIY
jgi:hypothetical protein